MKTGADLNPHSIFSCCAPVPLLTGTRAGADGCRATVWASPVAKHGVQRQLVVGVAAEADAETVNVADASMKFRNSVLARTVSRPLSMTLGGAAAPPDVGEADAGSVGCGSGPQFLHHRPGVPPQGQQPDARPIELGDGGQASVENQFPRQGARLPPELPDEAKDLVVLFVLSHCRIAAAEGAADRVADEEGEDTVPVS